MMMMCCMHVVHVCTDTVLPGCVLVMMCNGCALQYGTVMFALLTSTLLCVMLEIWEGIVLGTKRGGTKPPKMAKKCKKNFVPSLLTPKKSEGEGLEFPEIS